MINLSVSIKSTHQLLGILQVDKSFEKKRKLSLSSACLMFIIVLIINSEMILLARKIPLIHYIKHQINPHFFYSDYQCSVLIVVHYYVYILWLQLVIENHLNCIKIIIYA